MSLRKSKPFLTDNLQGSASDISHTAHGKKIVEFSSLPVHSDSTDPISLYLKKILNSKGLASSAALKTLLQYLIKKVQRSEQQQITEYSLGVEVFHRSSSFDPYLDTIVRVQMRRLRQKLNQYYNGEGVGDSLRIQIPRGSYVPVVVHSFMDRPCQNEPGVRCRLAVLPFLTLSPDRNCQMFADTLTETLIDDFAKSGNLDVVARTSSFIFKGNEQDIRLIAKHLNVDAVLEGSVQSFNNQFRIKVRLINAKTGFAVWSSKFEADPSNLLRSEEEISRSIVPVINALLSTDQHKTQNKKKR